MAWMTRFRVVVSARLLPGRSDLSFVGNVVLLASSLGVLGRSRSSGTRADGCIVRYSLRFFRRNLFLANALVSGSFVRIVDVQESKVPVLVAIRPIHRPQGPALAVGVLGRAFGVAVALLNRCRRRELRAAQTPWAEVFGLLLDFEMGKVRRDPGDRLVLLFGWKQDVKALFVTIQKQKGDEWKFR